MTELFKRVQDCGAPVLAIVGMTKNVGKTVTFNYLVKCFARQGTTLGLVSAGYDGERFDRLTLKDKPRIFAPQGTLVATAEACFDAAEAELTFLHNSTLSTPLGTVIVALVTGQGLVELAGPGSVSGLKSLIQIMADSGAQRVLVDGAINRLASASPQVAGGAILATGASVGTTMDDVIRKTVFRRELLEMPCPEEERLHEVALRALTEGNAAILYRKGTEYLAEPIAAMIPLLACEEAINRCGEDAAALVFGGALVDSGLEKILNTFAAPPMIIVQDATRFFISAEIYYRFTSRGGIIKVLDPLHLIAITLNPTDPGGRGYEPHMFLTKMSEAVSPLPVYDLVYQEGWQPNGMPVGK